MWCLWVGIRAVVSVISLLAVRFGAGPAALDGDDRPGGFFGLLHHWDSSYFLGVAAEGYFPSIPAPESAAFFPGVVHDGAGRTSSPHSTRVHAAPVQPLRVARGHQAIIG